MREIVTQDFGWKLFSVVLAATIWYTVSETSDTGAPRSSPLGGSVTTTISNLPVLVTWQAADVREFKISPETVDVTIRANPEIISTLLESDIQPIVNLTEVQSARNLRIRVRVSTPPGVTFLRVNPPEVNVVVPPKPDER